MSNGPDGPDIIWYLTGDIIWYLTSDWYLTGDVTLSLIGVVAWSTTAVVISQSHSGDVVVFSS